MTPYEIYKNAIYVFALLLTVYVIYHLRNLDTLSSLKFEQDPDVLEAWSKIASTLSLPSDGVDEDFWKVKDLIGYSNARLDYDKKVSDREYKRGTMMSIILVFFTVASQVLLSEKKFGDKNVLIYYGFVLIPTVGFFLDMAIGKDAGWRYFNQSGSNPNKNITVGWLSVISKFWSTDFFRYIISVLLDLFISNPLLESMTKYLNIPKFTKMSIIDKIFSKTSIWLQSIVNVVTFNSYTNQTRFNWAYASESPNPNRIGTGPIMVACGVASALFLSTSSGVFKANERALYCALMFALLSFGFQLNWLQPSQTAKLDRVSVLESEMQNLKNKLNLPVENFEAQENESVRHFSTWDGSLTDESGKVIGTIPKDYYLGLLVVLLSIVIGLRIDIPLSKLTQGSVV